MNTLILHLASVVVLALVVEVACRLGRFRPALCHALWLVVLVKLVVPPVVSWPVKPERLLAARYADFGTPGMAAGGPMREPLARGSAAMGAPAAEQGFAEGARGEKRAVGSVALRPAAVAGGVWLLGALLVAGRIVWEIRRSHRRVEQGQPLPAWLQSRLEETCELLGVPTPRAVVTHEPGGVFMQIAGPPALVLSADSLNHVNHDQWHTILTHELAHLKRRDHWVAWLMLAAGVVWWWNPCFWWARKRIHLYSEMACDAWVVRIHPGDRKQYAETMVRIMAMLSRQDPSTPAMGLAAWSAATQERRLWMIMKANGACDVPRGYATVLAAIALLAAPSWVAIGAGEPVATGAASQESPEVAAENADWTLSLAPSEALEAKLSNPANVEFEEIHLKDIFAFIQDTFEINIVLDQRVVKPEAREDGAAVPEAPLGGKPYASDGMVPYLNLKDTPLKAFFSAVTRPLQLVCEIRGHAVWVTSPQQLALDQAVPLPSAGAAEVAIVDKLMGPVNIEFEAIHVKEVIEFIQDTFEINIVLDGQVVMMAGKEWSAPPLGSPGYVTDGMLGYINLKDTPLGEALFHITRLLNLSYAVTDDYIFISSQERVNRSEESVEPQSVLPTLPPATRQPEIPAPVVPAAPAPPA